MIWTWLVSSLAIFITAYLIPRVRLSFVSALLTAIVLGLLNMFLAPILEFFALPLNILTLGLFSLVINALLIMLAGKIVPGFEIESFWRALLFGIVLAIVQSILMLLIG